MESYPIFKSEYLSDSDDGEFQKKLDYCVSRVNQIQNGNGKKQGVFLSYYPMAKNVRFCSSYMTRNVMKGRKSFVSNKFRGGEKNFWERNLKRGPIEPWLWNRGRGDENYTNEEGWKRYFKSFVSDFTLSLGTEILEPRRNEMIFYNYIASVGYTFSLSEPYIELAREYKEKICWPVDKKILAVHIRRGDACQRGDKKSFSGKVLSLDKYIQKIDKILDIVGYEYIFIATDSDEEIEEIKKIRPDWKLLHLPFDRKKFFRMESEKIVDLEDQCRISPEITPFASDSCIMDLYFIGLCDGYVSTITHSEFSRCGWYLQIFNQKKITPYINMTGNEFNILDGDNLIML